MTDRLSAAQAGIVKGDGSKPGTFVTPVVAPHLYALGGLVALDKPRSFIPAHLKGFLPFNCYILKDADKFLMVDAGLAVHREAIAQGISSLIAGTTERGLVMTRREPDVIINLPEFIKRFDLASVYCGGEISPLEFFDSVDEVNASAHLTAAADANLKWLRPGSVVEIGSLRLEVIRPALRVLATYYLYEQKTRTLFGSDSWGFLPQHENHGLGTVDTISDALSGEAIGLYLARKFDYLLGARTGVIADAIVELSATRKIDRICSSFGQVIEGTATVAHVLKETVRALEILSRKPRFEPLQDFKWKG